MLSCAPIQLAPTPRPSNSAQRVGLPTRVNAPFTSHRANEEHNRGLIGGGVQKVYVECECARVEYDRGG